jgi:hypothetical protein
MPSFWTQFKIHFLAEALSKVLFSGKSPKLTAFVFILFIGFVLLLKWVINSIFWCVSLPWQTKRAKVRRSLKRVAGIASKGGDISSGITTIGEDFELKIEGQDWKNGVCQIVYLAIPKTGCIRILVFGAGFSYEADYPFLRQYCGIPHDCEMRHEDLPTIHNKLSTNFL